MRTAPDTGLDRQGHDPGQWAIRPYVEQTADSGSGTCVAGNRQASGPDTHPASSLAAPGKPSPSPQRKAGSPSTKPVQYILGFHSWEIMKPDI